MRLLILSFLIGTMSAFGQARPPPNHDGLTTRPIVLSDASHHNFGIDTASDPFASWLREQGYDVAHSTGAFTEDVLRDIDVLMLNNPLAGENTKRWSLPTPSAYTSNEVAAIEAWVRAGGSLLMVVEHMPFPGAFQTLLRAFAITASNGFVVPLSGISLLGTDEQDQIGVFVYRRSQRALTDHAVLRGIDTLAIDWGSAFVLPDGSESLLVLPNDAVSIEPMVAWEWDEQARKRDVGGWLQAGLMKYGKGRVAVLGDNFILTHPGALTGPGDQIGAQHPQFTRNVFRWLLER